MKRPWRCYLGGSQKFLGYEQAWDTLLGVLVYCKALNMESDGEKTQSTGEDRNSDENFLLGALRPIMQDMLDMIKQLTELFSWPGIPPSLCYSVATSRGAYLLSLWDWGPYEELVRLSASCLVRGQLSSAVNVPQTMTYRHRHQEHQCHQESLGRGTGLVVEPLMTSIAIQVSLVHSSSSGIQTTHLWMSNLLWS
jgi:hypothetical protein